MCVYMYNIYMYVSYVWVLYKAKPKKHRYIDTFDIIFDHTNMQNYRVTS